MCRIIDDFRETIPPIVPGGKANRRLMTVHTLTLLAVLRLDTSSNWTTKSIEAALSVISLLDHIHPEELKPINPVIGFLWSGVGQVLIDESYRLGGDSGSNLSSGGNEGTISAAIDRLYYLMEECGRDCPYICVWLLSYPPTRLIATDVPSRAKSAIQNKRLAVRRREISSGSDRFRSEEDVI